MTDRDGFALLLLACGVLLGTIAWEILVRRAPLQTQDRQDRSSSLSARVPALLCAFLCAIGAILILPWAAFLPSAQGEWLPGVLFVALISVGAWVALGREMGEG